MAIFYQPPEPRQAYPKVLPVTQGAQPRPTGPLGGSAVALSVVGVWAALAAVPMPAQKPLNVAPLTLVYGQQPPVQGPLSAAQRVVARVSWPDDLRNQFNNQQPERRYIAPLTLVYGNQPPITGSLSVLETNLVVRSWDAPQQQPPPLIGSAAWNAPVVIVPIPVVGPITPQEMALVRSTWEPPAPFPPQLVNLVQTTGDQPIGDTKRVARHLAVRAWDVPFVSVPQPIGTAAWNVPAVVASQVPFSRAPILVVAQDWSAQRPPQIAPLTLTYGQNPPVNGAITPVELNAIIRAWDFTWSAQSQSPNAAWNVPLVIVPKVVFAPLPHSIVRAWQFDPAPYQPRYWVTPSGAAVTLDLAIAQSNSTDLIVAYSSATGTLMQNSGTVTIISSDSKTILLITGNSGVSSIDSDG